MDFTIRFSEDPGFVLRTAGTFLYREPVLHNLLLSIVHGRSSDGGPGRYWIALHGEETAGVVVQSPLGYPAVLTPMNTPTVLTIVAAIAESRVTLPGVSGDAATAATFAGHWSEVCHLPATPFQGLRLHELQDIGDPSPTAGQLRPAGRNDRSLLTSWTRAFQEDIGEPAGDIEDRLDRALAAGQLWIWHQYGEPVSMAQSREPLQGVVRVSGVYTPPEKRRHGYASACVHALSKRLQADGYRCVLYTDLGNPTSNSIYRRIGYRAVSEALRYRFDS